MYTTYRGYIFELSFKNDTIQKREIVNTEIDDQWNMIKIIDFINNENLIFQRDGDDLKFSELELKELQIKRFYEE